MSITQLESATLALRSIAFPNLYCRTLQYAERNVLYRGLISSKVSAMWETLDRLRFRLKGGSSDCKYGLVLSGGGARAAYQAGVMRYLADGFSGFDFSIMTGVSAGSLNVSILANDTDGLVSSVNHLVECWETLTIDRVYEVESGLEFFWNALRKSDPEQPGEILPRSGLVHTEPLRQFLMEKLKAPDGRLSGVSRNIESGRLTACAFVTTNYGTGQTVTWVEGRDVAGWQRPNRMSVNVPLRVEHIMASSSLPFLFPAVNIDDAWYGDGGIRLSDPLSPAIHLGADRILAISTRYDRSREEASDSAVTGYPPAAQIFGLLLNAIFLDLLDQDALNMARINRLLKSLPPWKRQGMRRIDLLVIRPSVDLGRLSGEYQNDLSGPLGMLAKALGSKDTKSPDWLSMLLFDPAYSTRLMEIGYEDARKQKESLERFTDPGSKWTDTC